MRISIRIFSAAIAFICCASGSRAATTTLADYRLGEDDPGATASMLGQDPTIDHGPGKLNLSRFGSPQYSGDVAPSALNPSGSTLSMLFSSKTLDAYYRLAPVTTLTDNVGIEAWVKSGSTGSGTGQSVIAYDGTPGGDGFGLQRVVDSTPFGGLAPVYVGRIGNTTVGMIAAPNDQWVHLALVRSGGVSTFYVNGAPAGTSTEPISAATQTFTVGASYCAVCDRIIPTADYFDGLADDVRVFSFEPGQFNAAADLSYRSVPEPGALAFAAGLALLLRRRRQ